MSGSVIENLRQWRWVSLLLLLLAGLFLSAATEDNKFSETLAITAYTLVFAGTLQAATMTPLLRYLGLGLVAVWFAIGLFASLSDSPVGRIFLLVTALVLVGCLLVTVSELARNRDAGLDPIMGAVFGYLLIAVSWSQLYLQIEIASPGSFNTASEHISASEFNYFSMVTLTSLGYGDITPAAPVPRLLAGLEAATGTIYIAVFIGRVVGRFRD